MRHGVVFACLALAAGCVAAAGPEPDAPDPPNALAVGRVELADALATLAPATRATAAILTADDPAAAAALAGAPALDARPGSFVVVPGAASFVVVGRDAAGAMYGAFELAERLRLDGPAAVVAAGPFAAAPALPIRGANLFLVLPEADEAAWWFHDRRFWRAYLDLLARARINFLDLHGMFDPETTLFPNALLWFATSPSHPEVGIAAAERERNLDTLRTIVRMARARGIDVGLMTYRSDASPSADGSGPRLSDAALRTYTREAAADLARRVPGLRRIGFRIGESGHDAAWLADTVVAGVQSAGTGVEVYTRTWGTTRAEVLALAARVHEPPVVEAKLNGEQLGAPYPIAGGAFVENGWANYSYEDYLDEPAPRYRFVFQVRAAGTHRIFRQASYARTQRLVRAIAVGAVHGFSLEAPHAYEPQREAFHADARDRFSAWTFRRDELLYLLYGRLGYDPDTPERVFAAQLARRTHTDALWAPLQAASDIVPWMQTANTCGPDHRDYAPELELGGAIDYWAAPATAHAPDDACGRFAHGGGAYHGPFDRFAVASPFEAAADLVAGHATARLSPLDVARRVLDDDAAARAAAAVPLDDAAPEARDVARDCLALADLGEWFAHKLRGASALAVYAGSGEDGYAEAARREADAAAGAWSALAVDTRHLLPFDEPLRMGALGLSPFHWSRLLPKLADDDAGIDRVVTAWHRHPRTTLVALPPALDWLDTPRAAPPHVASAAFVAGAGGFRVDVALDDAPAGTRVAVLYKPFSGLADWRSAPLAARGDGRYDGVVPGRAGAGGQFALELVGPGFAARWPDAAVATPYVAIAPR